jgi:hypothetical protein
LPGTELTPCQGSITYIESLGQLPTPTPTPLPTNTPAPDISFTDDFNSGASPDWDERTENWFTVNGTYTLREVGSDWTEGLALIGDNTWTDYTVSVEIDMKDSRDNIIDFRKESFILLRVQNEDNLIALRFTDGGYFRQAAWFLVENGIWNEVGNTRLERIYPIDNAFSVQVEVKGDFITANVNGTEMSFSGVPFSSGGIGLRIYTRNNNNPPTFDHFMIRPIAP